MHISTLLFSANNPFLLEFVQIDDFNIIFTSSITCCVLVSAHMYECFMNFLCIAQTSAVAIFNFGGVTGTIRFVQNQGSVEITVDLQNVEYHDSWHIHTLPVDLSINPQIRCSDDLIGQPYDPLNATQSNDNYEANCTSNITYCAVGDLYRKFGRIPTERTTLTDDTGLLSLTGRFGIIGRSVKIHSINSSFIDVCATIFSVDAVENGSRVVFVESYLVSPIAGNIYWYQVEGGDTQIWGNLFWVTAMSSTVNHSWSILNDQVNCNNNQPN